MTTKQFIEMLQKEDPKGEGHLRMPGGVPRFVESKAGYWDGPYQYIDEDGKFVTSIAGYKIDVHCVDIEDFASDLADNDEDQKWEDVEDNFRFELGGYANENQRNERIKSYIEKARASWEEMRGIKISSYERGLEEMRNNAEKGWSWFQNKKVDTEGGSHHYYTWKIYDETGKEMGSNIWQTESVQKSGEWEKLDDGVMVGYYHWVKKGCDKYPVLPKKIQKKVKITEKIKKFISSFFVYT